MKSTPILVLFVLSVLLLQGCKKEANDLSNNHEFSLSEAQDWFTSQYTAEINSAGVQAKSLIKPTKISFVPQWDKSIRTEDNELSVFEIPIKLEKKLGFKPYETADKESNNVIAGNTNLLISQNKLTGEIAVNLVHYSPVADKGNPLPANFTKIDKNFSGFIFLTDLSLNTREGIKIKNGITTSFSRKGILTNRRPPTKNPECITVVTDFFERECTEYYNGTVICTDWVYIGSESTTFCYTSDDGDGGGGGAGNSSCYVEISDLENSFYTTDQIINSEITYTNGTIRKKRYKWVFLKSPKVTFYSFEIGEHELKNGKWTWKSLTHNSIQQEGVLWRSDLQIENLVPTSTIGLYNAIMALDYTQKTVLDCPVVGTITSRKIQHSSASFDINY